MDEFLKECLTVISSSAQSIQSAVVGIVGFFNGRESSRPYNTSQHRPPPLIEEREEQISGFLEFTEKEILKMSKNFREEFRTKGKTAHVRKKSNGVYEIRCMIAGKNYSASSKLLETAKEKFIKLLAAGNEPPAAAQPNDAKRKSKFGNLPAVDDLIFAADELETSKRAEDVDSLIREWLEVIKAPHVKPTTLIDYGYYIKNYISPIFGAMNIKDVTAVMIQRFLNRYGETRTAQRIYEVMNGFFNYAENVDLVIKSPMRPIGKPMHIAEEKKPFTKQEEKLFIDELIRQNHRYKDMFILTLYTGLRRSEIKTAVIDDNWVTVKCAKQRRGHPVIYRKIPISPMLRKYLPLGPVPDVGEDAFTRAFKCICPNHNLHELRHTFNTRARECGVPKELVQKWCGHKPPKKDVNESVYMHYSDEYQLQEIKKVDYDYEF